MVMETATAMAMTRKMATAMTMAMAVTAAMAMAMGIRRVCPRSGVLAHAPACSTTQHTRQLHIARLLSLSTAFVAYWMFALLYCAGLPLHLSPSRPYSRLIHTDADG